MSEPVIIDGGKKAPPTSTPEVLPIAPKPLPNAKSASEPAPFKVDIISSTELESSKLPRGESRVEVIKADEGIRVAAPLPKELLLDAPKRDGTLSLKSVHIQYGHAENFQSVTGQVQAYRKTWRLRYAAIDQEDQYGGVLLLEGGSELSRLRDGQHVRLRGVLVPAEDRQGAVRYRVQAIEILD